MNENGNMSQVLATQWDATFRQIRATGRVAVTFGHFAASLVRIPLLMLQAVTLALALPFAAAQAVTGWLSRLVDGAEGLPAGARAAEAEQPQTDTAQTGPAPVRITGSFGVRKPQFAIDHERREQVA